jgi:large subunit ribosomal protein L35Ae
MVLEGVIVGYRRGPKTQSAKECIVRLSGVESANEAGRFVGRKIAWPAGRRLLRGKIVALHGKKGFVRARFRKGVPGEALGTLVEIVG